MKRSPAGDADAAPEVGPSGRASRRARPTSFVACFGDGGLEAALRADKAGQDELPDDADPGAGGPLPEEPVAGRPTGRGMRRGARMSKDDLAEQVCSGGNVQLLDALQPTALSRDRFPIPRSFSPGIQLRNCLGPGRVAWLRPARRAGGRGDPLRSSRHRARPGALLHGQEPHHRQVEEERVGTLERGPWARWGEAWARSPFVPESATRNSLLCLFLPRPPSPVPSPTCRSLLGRGWQGHQKQVQAVGHHSVALPYAVRVHQLRAPWARQARGGGAVGSEPRPDGARGDSRR